jgi:MFS family permease
VIVAGPTQALVTRVGTRFVMVLGLLLSTLGLLWYTQISVDGHYSSTLLPGYLLIGFGLAMSFIPVSIAALAGVGPREAGLASGLINTSQQIGGAIGVAIASTIATTHAASLLRSGHSQPDALTSGYALAFWVIAGFAAAGAAAAFFLVRSDEIEVERETAGAEA